MTADELRYQIKMDAQACEELTVGDEPLSPETLDDIANRAAQLQRNVGLYRRALRTTTEPM